LRLAQRMVERSGRRSVLLISDLNDSLFDVPQLTRVLKDYVRRGIRLRVVGLNPNPDDRAFWERQLGQAAFVPDAALTAPATRGDDLRFQVAPLSAGLWTGPGGPGSAFARRLLGVGDDVRFRNAEQLFVKVHTRQQSYAGETQRLSEFGQAQSTLQHLSEADPSPVRRSRAGNLLGILLFEDAESAQDNAPQLVRESLSSFRGAIRDFPADADPKYNL